MPTAGLYSVKSQLMHRVTAFGLVTLAESLDICGPVEEHAANILDK